jgi:hypothetical protein
MGSETGEFRVITKPIDEGLRSFEQRTFDILLLENI